MPGQKYEFASDAPLTETQIPIIYTFARLVNDTVVPLQIFSRFEDCSSVTKAVGCRPAVPVPDRLSHL